MSTVEARTREALHDVVDSLAVTDDDVSRMEAELVTALARPRRLGGGGGVPLTRRRWGLAAAAVVLAAAVAGGLALSSDDREAARPAGQPVSDQPLVPADIVGMWQDAPDSPWVWEFRADGEVLAVMNAAAYLEGFAGDRVVSRSGEVYTVSLAQGCEETWRIRPVRPGILGISIPASDCGDPESLEGGELQLERLSPDPHLAGELSVPPVVPTPGFPVGRHVIDGMFLHVESGTVLAIGNPWRGSVLRYVLDDDGDGATDPDERGRVTVPDSGVPVFQPDAGGGGSGCELRFASTLMTKESMTTTSTGGGCLPGPGPHTWVRLS